MPDLESVEKAISSGQLQSNRNGLYAHSSKVDIRRALKVYLRWRLGATNASALVGWFDALHDYLRQRKIEGIRADEPVFKRAYTAARLFLHRLGMRVLKRSIHHHLFRHSSATYYASKLNRQQLCIRYGWAFSSRMPDVHIARSGVDMEELDKKFTGTEVESLRHSLMRVEQASQFEDERIHQLEENLVVLQKHFATISAVLGLEPTVGELRSHQRQRPAGQARTDC